MIVPNKDGRYPSVYVPDGQSFTLHQNAAHGAGVQVLALRPRSTLALMALAGQQTRRTARLSDRNSFDVVDHTNDLVQLNFGSTDGRFAGHTLSFVKGVIGALDEDSPRPPKSVRVLLPRELPPSGDHCGCRKGPQVFDATSASSAQVSALPQASLVLRETDDAVALARQFSATHIYREVSVPLVLQNLRIWIVVVALGDIVVGRNATLTVGGDIWLAMADNVVMYMGARIVQSASFLSLDVTGRMQGNTIDLIHRFTDVLKIDHAALDAQLVTNNQ